MVIKIFAITCLLMIICSSATYGFIAWLVPKTYSTDLDVQLNKNVNILISELERTSGKQSGFLFDEFLLNNDVILQLFDEDNQEIAVPSQYNQVFPSVIDGNAIVYESDEASYRATHSYLFAFNDSKIIYTLCVTGDSQPVNQLINTIDSIAPILMIVIILISIVDAVFFSIYVTRPVIEISKVSKRMSELDFTWCCNEKRNDELGILAHSLNEMSQKLSLALHDLQTANSQLKEDINRERKLEQNQLDFFSAVSHELKTPITVIKGQLEGMLLNVGKYKERDKYLARSLEVVKSMEGMVQEILTISRIKSSGVILHYENFDLSEIIKEEYSLFEDIIIKKQLRWHEDIQKGLMIIGDRMLLNKVINNLVSNAVQYSPCGEEVFVSACNIEENIQFVIENTGVSLSDNDIPQIFNAFYRVEPSRNRQTGGSGLGLYIVKMILEQHQAKYQIENSALGVCFTINFEKKVN